MTLKNRLRGLPDLELDDEAIAIVLRNCDASLTAEAMVEARAQAVQRFGPVAAPVLHACSLAVAAGRRARELEAEAARVAEGTRVRGVVVGFQGEDVRVAIGGGERAFRRPDAMTVGIGQCVYTDPSGQQLLCAGDFLVAGQTYAFCEHLPDATILVRPLRDGLGDAARQVAILSDAVATETFDPEDHVLGYALDFGNLVLITRRIGPVRPTVTDEVGWSRDVERSDIVGLDDIVARVTRLFLEPPSPAYARLLGRHRRSAAGAVFCGVPGCGKSLVAEMLATQVRRRGGRALYRTASHYLDRYVGVGPARLRADFIALERAHHETGVPSLLVIDELEAIALDRHSGHLQAGHVDVLTTLLAILTRTPVRMIGISNVGDRHIDAALVRDGRLPLVSFPPTLAESQVTTLVAKCLEGVRLAEGNGHGAAGYGQTVGDLVFAPSGPLLEILRVQLADGRTLSFGAPELATAAAIADGIVRPTLEHLAQRGLDAGLPEPPPLTLDTLRAATLDYFAERTRTITRDNVRSVLGGKLPADQPIATVEAVRHGGGSWS